jgi:DAACS family dicarboxylate/amino acid:cation (Na+ or H+) symporter
MESFEPATVTAEPRKRWPLHTKILVGLLVGITLGLTAKAIAIPPDQVLPGDAGFRVWLGENLTFIATQIAEPIGKVFLRLIMMMVIPLVVSALALGVLELGDIGSLGRVGIKTLLYTLILSGCAVMIGIGLVNYWKPGSTLSDEQRALLSERYNAKAAEATAKSKQAKGFKDLLLDMIPENPLQEAVGALDGSSKGNGMLAVMFFALVLGAALSVAGERTHTLVKLLEGLFDISMVVIGWAMKIAPYGVACLLFSITSQIGYDILKTLGWFVMTALTAMAIQMLVVYPLMLRFVANRNPWQFYKDISEALLTAFGTSSSNATLPTALRVADKKLWLPNEISQFVLTIGSTGNQNGTALYEGVVVLFLAQVFGVDLTITQQITVVIMAMLAGVGTAGVPGSSIPLIVIVLQSVGVPGEGIGIILGIDRILDMCRTVLNVGGDLVLAACVARKST